MPYNTFRFAIPWFWTNFWNFLTPLNPAPNIFSVHHYISCWKTCMFGNIHYPSQLLLSYGKQHPPLTLKYSCCTTHWESSQKLLQNWHFTPTKLATISPNYFPLCWRQCDSLGTLFHIWWHCSLIHKFWAQVFLLITNITGLKHPPNPNPALLGLDMDSWPLELHPILTHIFIAAQLSIAHSWKWPTPLNTPHSHIFLVLTMCTPLLEPISC